MPLKESDVAFGPHCLLHTYAQHFEPGTPIAYRQFYLVTGERCDSLVRLQSSGIEAEGILRL